MIQEFFADYISHGADQSPFLGAGTIRKLLVGGANHGMGEQRSHGGVRKWRFDFPQRSEGYVTLLFFGYTWCPDQCPLHMANLGGALKKMPAIADQVKLVFVTTDPARDSAAVVRRWLDLFDRHFIGRTGTERAIEAVERAAGVPMAIKTGSANANYAVVHANFVLAYSKDNFAHVIYPGGVSKDDWVHDLPLLIKETWTPRAQQ